MRQIYALAVVAGFIFATPAAAVTKWIADWTLTTPLSGINDLHFEWEVTGDNFIDATPSDPSYKFTGVKWDTIKEDDLDSGQQGSVTFEDPDPAPAKDTQMGVRFHMFLRDGSTPTVTAAYWTINGYGRGDPNYQIDTGTLPFIAAVPLPVPALLLGAGLAGLGALRIRRSRV